MGNRDKGTHVLAPYILYNCFNESTAQDRFARCRGGAESNPCFSGRFKHPKGRLDPARPGSAATQWCQGWAGRGCSTWAQSPCRRPCPSCWAVLGHASVSPLTHGSWSEAIAGLGAGATIIPLFCGQMDGEITGS